MTITINGWCYLMGTTIITRRQQWSKAMRSCRSSHAFRHRIACDMYVCIYNITLSYTASQLPNITFVLISDIEHNSLLATSLFKAYRYVENCPSPCNRMCHSRKSLDFLHKTALCLNTVTMANKQLRLNVRSTHIQCTVFQERFCYKTVLSLWFNQSCTAQLGACPFVINTAWTKSFEVNSLYRSCISSAKFPLQMRPPLSSLFCIACLALASVVRTCRNDVDDRPWLGEKLRQSPFIDYHHWTERSSGGLV